MTELNKRILTSLLLIILFILAMINKIFLTIALFLIFCQIFHEFQIILKKIFIKKKILILILFFLLIYLTNLNIVVWKILSLNEFLLKVQLLTIITVCISSDIGGYLFGKTFQGKKITKISPNKTYSGMIGSYLISFLITFLIFKDFYDYIDLLIFITLISTISQFGDIFISFLKRKAKIKDTGNILPGHGGILDRFDGIIFAIPICLLIEGLL